MNLHLEPVAFEQYIQLAAQHFGLLDIFIEKDYWLCTVLQRLAQHPYADLCVFKGGTSLSKAYNMLERFSEDIDLALLAQGMSSNQAKNRISKVSKDITQHIPERVIEGITSKGSEFRKTLHEYPVLIPEIPGTQMNSFLLLEINCFGTPHPYQPMPISCFIADFLTENSRQDLINRFHLEPSTVQVLKPERTFCEKILALTRASYHQTPIIQLQNKIRHAFDLHMMMQTQYLKQFVNSDDLNDMLLLVQKDENDNRTNQAEWNTRPLKDALIFQDDHSLWKALEKTYLTSFAPMVYGILPEFKQVRISIQKLKHRLQ